MKQHQIQHNLLKLFIRFIFLSSISISCKTSKFEQQESDLDSQDSQESEEEEEEYASVSNSKLDDSLPHPRTPTAWNTNILILGSSLPPRSEIRSCMLETVALVETATNDYEILKAKENIISSVEEKEELYHWCFYSMMNGLDLKLDHVGLTVQKRKNIFFKRMRGLWILAQTLDEARDVKIYFKFLRTRYMDISKKFFGRDLEVVNAPFAGYKTQVKKVTTQKPAGSIDDLED